MTGYVTAASNEMTADAAGNTYSYDHTGNRTGKTDTAGNVWVYSWDYRNRLTEVTETNSSHTLVLDEKLTYDVNDNLISTKVGSTVQRWTVFDGKNPLLDFSASGSLTTRYLMNPQALDQFFARVGATGTTGWYLTDRLGSIREIVDPTATVLDQISYGTYGGFLSETNIPNGDRFKYNGGEFDFNIGLERFDARWTDPMDGRWISQDPLGLGPDSNPYRYCGNGPMNGTDPSGLAQNMAQYLGELVINGVNNAGRAVEGLPPLPPPTPPPRYQPDEPAAPAAQPPQAQSGGIVGPFHPDADWRIGTWPIFGWGTGDGYVDINVGGVIPGARFIGGGVQIGDGPPGPVPFLPGLHPYVGVQIPGWSVSVAPNQAITPGLNVGGGWNGIPNWVPGIIPQQCPDINTPGFQWGWGGWPYDETGFFTEIIIIGNPGPNLGVWWVF